MHYVYHPKNGSKIVNTIEYPEYLSRGWYDTPAKFPNEISKLRSSNENEIDDKKKRGRPRNDNGSPDNQRSVNVSPYI